jgi:hypothetical protein
MEGSLFDKLGELQNQAIALESEELSLKKKQAELAIEAVNIQTKRIIILNAIKETNDAIFSAARKKD